MVQFIQTFCRQRILVMMECDLGAASNAATNNNEVVKTFGLYYQFGRKDPFQQQRTKKEGLIITQKQ